MKRFVSDSEIVLLIKISDTSASAAWIFYWFSGKFLLHLGMALTTRGSGKLFFPD
jgi:hypothetical protein